jgi:hypothetical protein
MQRSLNKLFSDFTSGRISRADFEGSIYNYLVYNQEKTCLSHWERDEYEDYVSWFYPRLQKAIDSYHDIGASFEAFMSRFLLISSREFRVRITTNSVTEYSAWCAQVPELYAREEAPVYSYENAKNVITQLAIDKKGRRNTRRILALIIKCYYYVSEDFAERIAPLIGVNKKELLDMLGKIRKTRQKRDDQIYRMKERIHSQFYRCMIYERKLLIVEENTGLYNKLKLRLVKARQRLERMRKRITKIRTDATNKQVADIIGTSKGTVDASLHKLKLKWKKMSEKSDLN